MSMCVYFLSFQSCTSSTGDYGLPKPWYFPFTRKYWCGQASAKSEDSKSCYSRLPSWLQKVLISLGCINARTLVEDMVDKVNKENEGLYKTHVSTELFSIGISNKKIKHLSLFKSKIINQRKHPVALFLMQHIFLIFEFLKAPL